MATTRRRKNKFSIKAVCYPNLRQRHLDGPWRPSKAEAATAFAEWLKKRGLDTTLIFRPYITERVDQADAHALDSKGNFYRESEADLELLYAVGVRVDKYAASSTGWVGGDGVLRKIGDL